MLRGTDVTGSELQRARNIDDYGWKAARPLLGGDRCKLPFVQLAGQGGCIAVFGGNRTSRFRVAFAVTGPSFIELVRERHICRR